MNTQKGAHPTDQTLHAYGLGKLDDPTAESVNEHLESCQPCRGRVAELTSDSFLGRLRDAQVRPVPSGPAVSSFTGLSIVTSESSSAAPPPASTLPPGLADHADYTILRELGRGGMGVVYLAQNALMGRPEVLKVVGRHLVERPEVLERFLREIRSAARLHHPNIVTAYSALRLDDSLVLAMQYVEGLDLAKIVKSRGPLPVAHACNYAHQAALGLQHAHERGMVHRDIKPANLILAREGKKAVVKVLDFGLAKVSSEGQTDSGLTREGQMLGTPDFIAPEQIRDAQSADIRSDIYSLGCTLYYLLAGRPPFHGDHLWDLYQAHFSMDAGPLNLLRPEVPVELAALVAKMMAKQPDKRFQTPGEVAQALAPFFKTKAEAGSPVVGVSAAVSPASPASPAVSAVPTQRAPGPVSAPTAPVKESAKTARAEPQWESLIELKETEPLTNVAPVVTRPRRPMPRWPWPTVVAASVFGLIAFGVIIITIRDKNGETKIKASDDKYLKVESGQVTVEHTPKHDSSRGNNEEVRIEYEPKNAENPRTNQPASSSTSPASIGTDPLKSPQPGDRDRRAAEKALEFGGTVTIELNGQRQSIKPGEALPIATFRLTDVDLRGRPDLTDAKLEPFERLPNLIGFSLKKSPKVTDAGVAHLRNLPKLEHLWLNGTSVTDAGLAHLEGLSQLRVLRLEDTGVTNAGLVHLQGLSQLKFLAVGASRVTDAGLVHLRGLPQLKSLWLHEDRVADTGLADLRGLTELSDLRLRGTQVTDAGLVHLKGLTQIKVLELQNTRVTDAGLAHLSHLAQLENLWVGGTRVTDAGLAHLQGLTRIKALHLLGTRVTDSGLVRLRGLAGLERLSLEGSYYVTDAGLLHLKDLSWLKEVHLEGTSVTAAGVAGLKKTLPACRIFADPAVLPVTPPAERAANKRAQSRTKEAVRSPNGKLRIVSGLWRLDGREWVQTHPDGGMCILLDDPSLSRFEMRFSAMVVEGKEGFSAVFHYSGPRDNCQLAIGDSGRRAIAMCPRYKGKWEFHGKPKDIPTELGRWYDVRIKVDGQEYQCFVDGKELFHNTLDDRFVKGCVGLGAWESVVRYRDITISTLDGRVLWHAPPDLGAP